METLLKSDYFLSFATLSFGIFILWCLITFFINLSHDNGRLGAQCVTDRSTTPEWFKKIHLIVLAIFGIAGFFMTYGVAFAALLKWDYAYYIIVPFVIWSIYLYIVNK